MTFPAGQLSVAAPPSFAVAHRAWVRKLEMTPVDEEITRYVERIVVSGRAGRVAKIEVLEASGDRSVLTVN